MLMYPEFGFLIPVNNPVGGFTPTPPSKAE